MKKVLSIIIALIAVVIIAAIAFIKFYITPERVKAFVVPAAESALNRKVDIGEISINIFEGIGIKNFAIKEADNKSDFLKCDEFVLKFKLLPLFAKQVVIDEMKFVSPEIMVRRDRDGKFNFEDIGKKEITAEVKPVEEGEANGALPISLLVDSIVISDARFSLVDLKKDLPDLKITTDINISIKSTGTSEISTRGSIALSLDEIVMRGPEERLIKDLKAALDYDIRVNLETLDIEIEKADMEFQEIPISISGSVSSLKDSPELDLAVTLPRLEIAKVQKAASPFITIDGLGLSGGLSVDMKLKGKPGKLDSMKMDGDITLDKVGVSHGEINAQFDGKIEFSKEVMDLKIAASVGRNKAELTGSVRNYFEDQDIKMDLYAKKLYLDEVIPVGAAGPGTPAGKGETIKEKKAPQKEAEALKLKLKAEGTVRIDSAVYKGMTMSSFFMKYSFRDNKLVIPKMTANAGKGKFDLKSVLDLSKPGYRYDLSSNLDSLHAEEVVNAFFPKAKDTVFGVLSFNLKLKGAGTLPESIKKNLVANGDFNIRNGKITDTEITKKLSGFLNIGELETIHLRKASGKVDIKDRIAKLDSIFTSDDIAMDPKGTIGLDETLDLAFDLKLSSRLTDKAMMKSNIAKFIKNDQGWGVIPLKISGTFSEPSYAVDMEKAGKMVIRKEADKFLDKIFNKNGNNGNQELEPVKELLKGLFR